jgi:hypothetical protein
VGLDGGRDRGVACVGRGVEKVLPEMQRRDWWAGISSLLWVYWASKEIGKWKSCGGWLAALPEYLPRLGARAALPRSALYTLPVPKNSRD